MNSETRKILSKAEDLDWVVQISKGYILFSKLSPEGQDFNIEIDLEEDDEIEEIIGTLYERYDNFDVSEETYMWLDDTGHGKNGAPYDMKDIYEDIEACQEMILELYNELNKYQGKHGSLQMYEKMQGLREIPKYKSISVCYGRMLWGKSTAKSEEQLILEDYLEQGFVQIFKYKDKDVWTDSGKYSMSNRGFLLKVE